MCRVYVCWGCLIYVSSEREEMGRWNAHSLSPLSVWNQECTCISLPVLAGFSMLCMTLTTVLVVKCLWNYCFGSKPLPYTSSTFICVSFWSQTGDLLHVRWIYKPLHSGDTRQSCVSMSRHGWTSENCSYTNNQKLYWYFFPFKNYNLINNKQALFFSYYNKSS